MLLIKITLQILNLLSIMLDRMRRHMFTQCWLVLASCCFRSYNLLFSLSYSALDWSLFWNFFFHFILHSLLLHIHIFIFSLNFAFKNVDFLKIILSLIKFNFKSGISVFRIFYQSLGISQITLHVPYIVLRWHGMPVDIVILLLI